MQIAELDDGTELEFGDDAKRTGQPVGVYNPTTVMAKLRDAKERVTADKAVDASRAALQAYGAAKRITLGEHASETELRMLKFSPLEIREIQRHQRILRGD